MKKQLLKKFNACLSVGMAFIVTAIMFSVNAKAQIVYTDVNPDLTFIQSSPGSVVHNIDINNDGITDATMTAELYVTGGIFGQELSKNVWVGTAAGSQVLMYYLFSITMVAKALNYNAIIDSASPIGSNENWSNAQNIVLANNPKSLSGLDNPIPYGDWSDTTDRYLALRISVGGAWFYGWVRVSVSPDSVSFTIRDYAYNSTPNQSILAGQTVTTGIDENSFASLINLFPNPADNNLTIDLGSNNKKVQVTIADITGKIMYTTMATDTQKVEVNTRDFAEGIYVVQIQTADFIGATKLVVEK